MRTGRRQRRATVVAHQDAPEEAWRREPTTKIGSLLLGDLVQAPPDWLQAANDELRLDPRQLALSLEHLL